jgi:hypothetical protein
MNPNGKVQLVFANVPRNLFVPLISKNLDDILAWNKKVNEYIVEVFDFAHMFLVSDGAILLFHPNTSNFEGGQVLFGELWFINTDEVGCGEIIATYKQ